MSARTRPDLKILWAAGSLALAVFAGLAVGAGLGIEGGASQLAIPALALQTFLSVGAIPRRERGADLRPGLTLFVLHWTVATLPLVLVAVIVGLDDPIGFGLLIIAVAPPGGLIPALAARLQVDVRSVLVFCLAAYGVSLVLTPAILLLVAGSAVGAGAIARTVGVGLIAPSLLGRLAHERIVRVSPRIRRNVVNATVFLITMGLGGEIVDGFREADVGPLGIGLIALVVTLRAFGGGWLAARLAPDELADEARLAGGFKNVALAAAVGGALMGPAAALPGLMGFLIETAYFLKLAWGRAKAEGAP